MSAERTVEDYLRDILEYSEKAEHFLEGIPSVEALREDEKTLLAVVRALEVIGEAAKRIPKTFQDEYPHVRDDGDAGQGDSWVFWG